MSQQAVERTLGKLLTDEAFREQFFLHPERASWEAGLELSPTELDALSKLSRGAVARLSVRVDARIRHLGAELPSPTDERWV